MDLNLSPEFLVSSGQVHPSWFPSLEECREELTSLEGFLNSLTSTGIQILPKPSNIFRALKLPVDQVKVVIIGQDPYPTPGHAMGLAFSVTADVQPIPRTLANIFTELNNDLGCERPPSGDLTPWADQGVLLLNRVLTVSAGEAGSHRRMGWETITTSLVQTLAIHNSSVVAVLWGKDAQQLGSQFPQDNIIVSAHPSPLSASRGFWGSKTFSAVNELLQKKGIAPISWQ